MNETFESLKATGKIVGVLHETKDGTFLNLDSLTPSRDTADRVAYFTPDSHVLEMIVLRTRLCPIHLDWAAMSFVPRFSTKNEKYMNALSCLEPTHDEQCSHCFTEDSSFEHLTPGPIFDAFFARLAVYDNGNNIITAHEPIRKPKKSSDQLNETLSNPSEYVTKKFDMPPKKRTVRPPVGGWKEKTYYAVWIAFGETNPIHQSIFYCGFLSNGQPGGYNQVWNPTYDLAFAKDLSLQLHPYSIESVHYLEVIAEIPQMKDSA